MSRPQTEITPTASRRVRFGRLALAIATVGGLAIALVTLPASAHRWATETTTTANTDTDCDPLDRPDNPGHWRLETELGATGNSSFHKLKVWTVIRVGNTYFDDSQDTFVDKVLRKTVFDYCNSQKSVEVWYTTGANSSTDMEDVSDLLKKYASGGTNNNEKNPLSTDSAIKRWQYTLTIPQGYSMGSTIMYYTLNSSATIEEFEADRWVCAIVRVNSGWVTTAGTTNALARGTAVSNADGPSNQNQRGHFSNPLCVRTNANYARNLQDAWDHNCDADGNGISGEVSDADFEDTDSNTAGLQRDQDITYAELKGYQCIPHPCDIRADSSGNYNRLTIEDIDTQGIKPKDWPSSWPHNTFSDVRLGDAHNACKRLCDNNTGTVTLTKDPVTLTIGPPVISTTGASQDHVINWADADSNGDGHITSADDPYPWRECGMKKVEAELGRQLEWWEERLGHAAFS